MEAEDVLEVEMPDALGIAKVHRHRAKMHLSGKEAEEVLGDGGDPRELAPILALLAADAPDTAEVVDGDLLLEDARIVHGGLEVRGNVDNRAVLIVTGNVEVQGSYVEDGGQLLVAGDLAVRHVVAAHDVLVLGDLEARGAVWVSGEDGSLLVGGTLTATVLVNDEHEVRYAGLAAGQRIDGVPSDDEIELFAPATRGDDGVDLGLVTEQARNGKPVLAKDRPDVGDALPLRVVQLLDAIAAGATHEWTDVGGRPALRLTVEDGSRQISVLSPEEKEALEGALGS